MASAYERFEPGVVFHLDRASRENGTNVAGRRRPARSVWAHPPGMLHSRAHPRPAGDVDRQKINLSHNFGRRRPPAPSSIQREQRWCCHLALLVQSCIRHSSCQRAPRWFLSFGFELNASGSQTIVPPSPVSTTYFRSEDFALHRLTTLPCHFTLIVIFSLLCEASTAGWIMDIGEVLVARKTEKIEFIFHRKFVPKSCIHFN